MEEELVTKLINFVESASPVIWEAAQRQVVAEIASKAIWALALVALSVFLIWLTRKSHVMIKQVAERNKGKSVLTREDEGGVVFAFTVSIATTMGVAIFFFVLITDIVKMAINPTYYAVYNILHLVG